MSAPRPLVLAVSNCDQYRETLSILLDREYDVAPVLGPESLWDDTVPPGAVVLSPARWSESDAPWAHSRFPHTPLVFLDPPPAVTRAFPDALVATWSDPHSVRAAVARATTDSGALAAAVSDDVCVAVLRLAERELARPLRVARVLARLAQVTSLRSSTYVATRFLAEQASVLLDRLAWAAIVGEGIDGAERDVDLVAELRRAIEQRPLRLVCRGLRPRWPERSFALRAAPERVQLVARCLADHVLSLRDGEIEVSVEAHCLSVRHSRIESPERSLALEIAARVLQHIGCHQEVQPGWILIRPLPGS